MRWHFDCVHHGKGVHQYQATGIYSIVLRSLWLFAIALPNTHTSKISRCRQSVFTPHRSSWGRNERGYHRAQNIRDLGAALHLLGRDTLRDMLLLAPLAILEDRRRDLSLICRHPTATAAIDAKVVATSSSHAAHVPEPMSPAPTRTKCANDALHQMMSSELRRGCGSLKLATGVCLMKLPG